MSSTTPKPQDEPNSDAKPEQAHAPLEAPRPPTESDRDEPASSDGAAAESTVIQAPAVRPARSGAGQWLALAVALLLGLAALVLALSSWLRLNSLQDDWGRRVADVIQAQRENAGALQNLTLQAQRAEVAAQGNVGRLSELRAQQTQLENVVKQLSQTQDQSLVQDIESMLRMATAQAEAVGDKRPLVQALQAALSRVARSDQLRTGSLQVALSEDLAAIEQAEVADLSGMVGSLSQVVQAVALLPLGVAEPHQVSMGSDASPSWWAQARSMDWMQWSTWGFMVRESLGQIFRIREAPQASALTLAPEQAVFLSQQLQLRLLAARVAIMNRQVDVAKQDIERVIEGINQFAQLEQVAVQEVLQQLRAVAQDLNRMALPVPTRSLVALTGENPSAR